METTKFIAVHDLDGKTRYVNIDHIIQIVRSEATGGSHIYMILDHVASVRESEEDIYKLIESELL